MSNDRVFAHLLLLLVGLGVPTLIFFKNTGTKLNKKYTFCSVCPPSFWKGVGGLVRGEEIKKKKKTRAQSKYTHRRV